MKAVRGAFRAEILQLSRSRVLLLLALLQAVTFLCLVSLFGLTGSMAPTAVVVHDHGPLAEQFIENLTHDHHSFAVHIESAAQAQQEMDKGHLVDIITIPKGFSQAIQAHHLTDVSVLVDNINTDMTDDIQRALPSAIVAFGHDHHLLHIHVHPYEHDLLPYDTGFVSYLLVSALALDAFIVAGILGGAAVTREMEAHTNRAIEVSPTAMIWPLIGRVLAAETIAYSGVLLSLLLVVAAFHLVPIHFFAVLGLLALCTLLFGFCGAILGLLFRRTLSVSALVFGLSLPAYIDCGALEPERFDGQKLWLIAHFSPFYYAVGALQYAYHGLLVTPERPWLDSAALGGWLAIAVICCLALSSRQRKMV